MSTNSDIALAFFDAPVLETADGSWFEIRNLPQAAGAAKLSGTAIEHFWVWEQEALAGQPDPHRWFILVSEGKAVVTMAAVGSDQEQSLSPRVADCHVTGHRNANAWEQYQSSIEQLAARECLRVYPNHMGEPLDPAAEPEDDGSNPGF